eukprot:CAMPEP_0204374282 /NCGR_PEP_ID=MMETSP0469-20131031/48556_1 /ASSEMBLY_ACC=CAM_ASM_000384 /TAXON_ID=2969 /ORGANISM="Oxyrrhis marina" /LENGTH=117 /DNA_ID=CAMNT_0051364847 /DNA_START=1 /DNA_END=354 /DNA_ORIENTATION=+
MPELHNWTGIVFFVNVGGTQDVAAGAVGAMPPSPRCRVVCLENGDSRQKLSVTVFHASPGCSWPCVCGASRGGPGTQCPGPPVPHLDAPPPPRSRPQLLFRRYRLRPAEAWPAPLAY